MAKDLNVDQGTIRSRMKKLQESHVLRGWYLGVSPGVSGRDVIHEWLVGESPSRKADLTRRLLSLDDVERVCNYLGPRVSLVLLSQSGTDPDLSLERLAAATGLRGALRRQAFIPVPPRRLKKTDAAIVESLRADPWKPYSSVAKELRLSSKTVKRRVTQLADSGAIYMLPIIDLKALDGITPMELVVEYCSTQSREAVNRAVLLRIKENLIFSDVSGPHGYFALAVPNVSQVEQIAEWVGQQKGVREVHSGALQEVALNRKHYEPSPSTASIEREHVLASERTESGREEPETAEAPR